MKKLLDIPAYIEEIDDIFDRNNCIKEEYCSLSQEEVLKKRIKKIHGVLTGIEKVGMDGKEGICGIFLSNSGEFIVLPIHEIKVEMNKYQEKKNNELI